MSRAPLADRHVLVTGGSKGVGAALVAALLAQGARVTVAARPSPELERLAQEAGVTALPIDLADFAALDGYVAAAEKRTGPVDVLINNAALVCPGPLAELKRADLQRQIAANLLAPMELCRQVLPGMIARQRGTIVNVSSMVAELGIPHLPAYVAAKAGLSKFTLDLQADLKRDGARVHAPLVILGEIPGTQINAGFREDRAVSKLADRFAKLPVLTPGQVADAIIALIANPRQDLLVLPRYNAPMVHWRQWPIRLTQRLIG